MISPEIPQRKWDSAVLENSMCRGAWQATKISLIMKRKHYFWLRGIRSPCGGSVSRPPLKGSASEVGGHFC